MARLRCSLALAFVAALASQSSAQSKTAPEDLVGQFQDDYGGRFRVSDEWFEQLPNGRFRVVEWNAKEQFLIAQNADTNKNAPGLWTRIDWMMFEGMAPYTWGFCLTAYEAPTEASARGTKPANRATPRTGCNGYPFSRMAKVP